MKPDVISRQAAQDVIDGYLKNQAKDSDPRFQDGLKAAFALMNLVPTLEYPEDMWIDVEEDLPKIGEHHVSECVLCYCEEQDAYAFSELEENVFGQMWFSCERPNPNGDDWSLSVSHWMPLPKKPPRKHEEEDEDDEC